MSDADATTCDNTAKDKASTKLDAVDTCVGNFCVGMNGGTARCKADATSGDLRTSTARPPFDPTTGDPKRRLRHLSDQRRGRAVGRHLLAGERSRVQPVGVRHRDRRLHRGQIAPRAAVSALYNGS